MPGYHWLPDRLKVRAQTRRGRADEIRLRRNLPAMTESESAPSTVVPNIADRHEEYSLATGTNTDMAVSVELCRFLVQYCAEYHPERIADLGSGITSWTLRTWRDAQCPSCNVISVDDNPDWLKRSREFSAAAGSGTDGFYTWEEFLDGPAAGTQFDLVVYDFGSVRDRATLMQSAFDLVAPGGERSYVMISRRRGSGGQPGQPHGSPGSPG
jgi:SAM-dependent methyltransferase